MADGSKVRIRGTKDGVTIALPDGPWDRVLEELDEHLGKKPDFFRGGRVAVSVGERHLDAEAIRRLGDVLTHYGMTLWEVWSAWERTQREVSSLGLETGLGDYRREGPTTGDFPPVLEHAKIVYGPIRSGQHIQYPGSILVLGDVHPGAEVIGGGHIIVWGRLQGIAHAGAPDRSDVFVCALAFAPTQVRIGPLMAQGNTQEMPAIPEVARVEEGQIVVEPWTMWRRYTMLGD